MIPSEAKQLALNLIQQNGLIGWEFRFDSAVQRFGCCYSSIQVISLSYKLTELNSEEEVKDTILHEIAHALNPHENHGRDWKNTCIKIGARPERCYTLNTIEVPVPKHVYIYVCPDCGREVVRNYRFHKKYACGECCMKFSNNKYNKKFILVLKEKRNCKEGDKNV
jgi:predicted SprT family Zn-dependent metalloprotease